MKSIKKSQVRKAFESQTPFRDSDDTLHGISNPPTIFVGELNDLEKSRLKIDIDNNGIRYVVVSYGTPIAWVTDNGHTYRVQQDLRPQSQAHKRLLD